MNGGQDTKIFLQLPTKWNRNNVHYLFSFRYLFRKCWVCGRARRGWKWCAGVKIRSIRRVPLSNIDYWGTRCRIYSNLFVDIVWPSTSDYYFRSSRMQLKILVRSLLGDWRQKELDGVGMFWLLVYPLENKFSGECWMPFIRPKSICFHF